MGKKIALVLSGGGAKGAFQVGAEKFAREVAGYRWDVISGVSIGALNGALIAMGRYQQLEDFWKTLSPAKLYGRSTGHAAHIVKRMVMRKPSFYTNYPIREFIDREVDASKMAVDLRVGAVSMTSGEYRVFKGSDPHFKDALLASMALPPIFPPIKVGTDHMFDGGVRKVSPVSDVLDAEPDEVVIINCNPMETMTVASPPSSALAISQRAFALSMHQVFVNDVKKFLLLNRVAQQAEAAGVILKNDNGRPYRRYPCVIIEPDECTGDTTDVSPAHIKRALDAGWEKAKKILR
jgi:NTE family protein